MKKLLIQIPCFNEEKNLPITFFNIPKKIRGIDEIIILVINDGSEDQTLKVAGQLGIHHIISFKNNKGLAAAFNAGLDYARKIDVDFLVNLDADNQYMAQDIEKILIPLLRKKADIVVGERPIDEIQSFSKLKKTMIKMGSKILHWIFQTHVLDAPSGFRSYNHKAIKKIRISNSFSHTIETLMIAKKSYLNVIGVPIRVNQEVLRPSRLFNSNCYYIFKNLKIISQFIVRNSSLYRRSNVFRKSIFTINRENSR